MTESEESRALFERVLEALTRANGDGMALKAEFTKLDSGTRALAMIRALLAADEALGTTFAKGDPVQRDGALARRAALALAARADTLEAGVCDDRKPVRLSELLPDGLTF